jgi:hypothetical protein
VIQVFHCTEIGCGRENEDAFAVCRHPADTDVWLCVVADGMGGQPGGGPAARLACRTCVEGALAFPPHLLTRPETWVGLLQEADRAVANDPTAGFTTLVAMCVKRCLLAGASNGDSAAVMATHGRPTVQLTSRQAKNPPIGSGESWPMAFAAEVIQPWRVLVMTDGVWKYAGWDNVFRAAEAMQGPAILDVLRAAVRLQSGVYQDDFTLVVLQDR